MQLDAAAPDEVATHLHDVVDARVAGLPPELHALVRSMLTVPEATAAMRDYLFLHLSAFDGVSDADLSRVARTWVSTGLGPDRTS